MPNPIHTRRDPISGAIKRKLRQDASGLWLFENGGNLGLDSSSQGNHLTNNNSVSQVAGRVGQAAGFVAASSQSLSRADNASLSAGARDFVWAGWVYPTQTAATQRIVGQWSVSAGDLSYILTQIAGGALRWTVSADGTAAVNVDSTITLVANTWYFVRVRHQNGVAIGIQVNNEALQTTAHTTGVRDSSLVVSFGSRNGSDQFFDGRLDNWGRWNRLLTTAEGAWLAAGNSLA